MAARAIPGSRSCAGTARPPTARRSAGPCPTRCRSATGGTCGQPVRQGPAPRSVPTPPAGPRSRPAPGGSASRPPASAGSRSTRCSSKGVGLLDCARRLNLALNTVKRYARTREPDARPPRSRATGPPSSTPTATTCATARQTTRPPQSTNSLREIRELGYTGSSNLPGPLHHPGPAERRPPRHHPAAWPGSCSPTRPSAWSDTQLLAASRQPARR